MVFSWPQIGSGLAASKPQLPTQAKKRREQLGVHDRLVSHHD